MGNQTLPAEKTVTVAFTENDVICIAQALLSFNSSIDRHIEALAQGPVSGFNFDLLHDYYNKRKHLNKTILKKIKNATE